MATLLFLGKLALGGDRRRREKRRKRRRIRSLEEELDEETSGSCRKICLTLVFIALAILTILVLFLIYNIIFFIPNAILLGLMWLFRKIWSSDFFISTFFSIVSLIHTLFQVLIAVWNPLSVLGPPLAALWNIIWDIIFFLLAGFFGLICTGQWQDPGFNPLVNCPLLMDLLALSPILAEFLYDVIQVVIEIINLIGNALKTVVCFDRVGAFIAPNPTGPAFYSNGVVVADCTWFCAEVAGTFDPSCYNFVNLIRWTFPANFTIWALRLAQFLSNLFDFTMPFWWDGMRWIAFKGAVSEIYECPTLWCMTTIFWSDPLNITRKLVKVLYGVLIDFFLAPLDRIGCTFFSEQIIHCVFHPICSWVFPPFSVGPFTIDICSILNSQSTCLCNDCPTGWDKTFGYIPSPSGWPDPPFIGGCPCSLDCPSCHYTAYLVLAAIPLYVFL